MADVLAAPASTPSPEIAVVLVTSDPVRISKVLRCYRAGTDLDLIEIVVVALAGAPVERAALTALGFRHVHLIAVDGFDFGRAEEAAVRAATAPYVVFGQVHGYPRPGFVAALLAVTRAGQWTIVGPAMANANPESRVSWAAMCIHYGPWSVRKPRGAATSLPGHHSAYQRAALLALGSELYPHLDAGNSLQEALAARGGTFLFEPAAVLAIVNISRLGSFLADQFLQATKFARQRRRGWSALRRLLYVAGAPLIPIVRLGRVLRTLHREARLGELARGWAPLAAGLIVNAAGECLGYAADVDVAPLRVDTALDRLRYVRAADRRHELDESTWPT
ncbi:MAG: hypothetical protein ABIR79_00900 [Candidatus Binatia bacterium]